MKHRINVTISDQTLQQARRLARKRHTSLSGLIESLLTEQTTRQNNAQEDLLSMIRSLPKPQEGLPPNGDFKTEYYEQKRAEDESFN